MLAATSFGKRACNACIRPCSCRKAERMAWLRSCATALRRACCRVTRCEGRLMRDAAQSRRWLCDCSWRSTPFCRREKASSSARSQSLCGCAHSSAAAVGVGARTSAQKSAMVKSVSCPTPHTTGTGDEAMARASCSSLNAHKSSMAPPPRTSSSTSIWSASRRCQALARAWRNSPAAWAPCTLAG